jgi:histidinol-phosphate aminotransferase
MILEFLLRTPTMTGRKPDWVDQIIAPQISGIPPYVPGKPVAELTRELGIKDAVKMASNENPLGPSPLAVKAIEDHLNTIHVYPESSAPELRRSLARVFRVSENSIILGNGSDEIMALACHVFLRPNDEAIMGANAFSMYRICVEAFGGKPVLTPLSEYRNDLGAIADAVTDRTRIIFLAVPNSPTGTIVSLGEFQGFLQALAGRKLVLVVDEAYREYVADPDCPSGLDYLNSQPPVLVLRTFSKIYGLAGLRIGYGIGPEWLVELLNRVRPPFNVNSLAQVAAEAALEDNEHVLRSKRLARDGIAFLTDRLEKLGIPVIPSQANFLTFCMKDNAGPIYEALLQSGVIVRHLASFGMEKCIRVTVGTHDQNQRFIEALEKILR